MPRIIRLYAFGGPENLKLDDLPSQQPGPGQVRLRVEASSVTRDHFTFMSGRQFRGHGFVQPSLPTRLGYESAGVIDQVGEGVDATWVGKRVSTVVGFDESRYGTLGEEAIVPVANVYEYPSNLTGAEAAAFWVPYLTAYGGLVHIARVERGDFVSISAGSSSVGLAAVQFARDSGATAIAVIRRAAKKDEVLSLGAQHVIVTDEEDYESRVRDITEGKGVRICFDPIGGPFVEQLAAASAPGGMIVEYGVLSGQPATLPVMPLIGKGLSIRGYTVSEITRDPAIGATAKEFIYNRLADGRFRPKVDKIFPLDRTADAYRYVSSSQQIAG